MGSEVTFFYQVEYFAGLPFVDLYARDVETERTMEVLSRRINPNISNIEQAGFRIISEALAKVLSDGN